MNKVNQLYQDEQDEREEEVHSMGYQEALNDAAPKIWGVFWAGIAGLVGGVVIGLVLGNMPL